MSEETKRKISESNKGKHCKPVRCIETGVIYESAVQAEKETSALASKISSVCRGKQKITGGFHWEFVNKNTQ